MPVKSKSSKPASGSRVAARKRPVQPEDLLRYVFVGDPQISPDGSTVLFTRKHVSEKNEYVLNLWTVPADGGSPRQFTAGGKDAHGRWSPDGRRIAFVRSVKGKGPQIFVIDAAGGEATALTSFPEGAIASFKWSPTGGALAAQFRDAHPEWTEEARKEREAAGKSTPPRVMDDAWYRLDGDGYFGDRRFALYRVDAATGAHTKVFDKDPLGGFSYDWSPDGKKLAVTANPRKRALYETWRSEILIVDAATGKSAPVPGLPVGSKDSVAWSPDGKLLAYAGKIGKDDVYGTENLQLFVCDPVKGNARSLTGHTDYCLLAIGVSDTSEAVFSPTLRWAPDGRRLHVLLGWHGESHVASVHAAGGPVAMRTDGTRALSLGNVSADGRRMALIEGTPTALPEIAVGEADGDAVRVRRLTAFNEPVLRELEIAVPEPHWVTTPDGARVHTWVLLPPGFKKRGGKKIPAVLEIHGGPHAMYGVGYFHEFQTLAAAGHAVVFSNPRGSKGYGRDHCAAIHGKWGAADWVDIQAVTRFMAEQPWVDAKRLAVMGGSYGGYMTNWAIGHSDAYAAAITDRSVSNLVSMSGSSDFPLIPDVYWEGNFWDRPEALWAQSPIQYMGKVKTPTLIIHSEGDLRCNIEQGEQVFTLLQYLGVPSRFVRYPSSTSHGMSRSGPADLRIHRLQQILGWYAKYLK